MGIEAVRRQSIVSFLSQIALTIFGFFSTVYFAHEVGAGALGVYFLFLAYYGIITLVTDGGFGGAVIKRISEGEEQNEYLSGFIVIRSLLVVLTVITLIIFKKSFVDLESSGTFFWLIFALMVSIFSGIFSYGNIGCSKMGIHATSIAIGDLSKIIIQVIAVYAGFGVAGLVGGFVSGMITATLIERRFFDLFFVRFGWRHIRSLSTFSFWMFLTSSGMQVFSYSDTLIIGYYLNNADVGVYRTVMQFATFATIIASTLTSTLLPRVSRWGKTGEIRSIENSLSYALNYSLLLAFPIIIGGIILGDKLLYYFFGAEFISGYSTFIILLIVQLFNIFNFFFITYLGALDHQKDLFKVTLVSAIINIILNIILIPFMGIIGAAIATLIAMMFNTFLARSQLSKIIRIRIDDKTLFNILKATSLMSFFLLFYRFIIPLSSILLLSILILLGATLYIILISKFDNKIYEELMAIIVQIKRIN